MNVRVSGRPLSATGGQFRRHSAAYGEVASAGIGVEDQSTDRSRELGEAELLALVGLDPEIAEPQPAVGPVWWAGTLPGVMAGKRPPRKLSSPIWGRVSQPA